MPNYVVKKFVTSQKENENKIVLTIQKILE